MICDFGLSRVIESDKMALLTEICGTPGVSSSLPYLVRSLLNAGDSTQFQYMAPEIFLKCE